MAGVFIFYTGGIELRETYEDQHFYKKHHPRRSSNSIY